MLLRQVLESGDAGLRWDPPASFDWRQEDRRVGVALDPDRRVTWIVRILPWPFDLRPAFADVLRRDIEAERAQRRDWTGARFEGFELSRACTWMTIGREANRLPYWSCYRSTLRVAVGGRSEGVEVRVMIHWGDRWYATHLGAIPARH